MTPTTVHARITVATNQFARQRESAKSIVPQRGETIARIRSDFAAVPREAAWWRDPAKKRNRDAEGGSSECVVSPSFQHAAEHTLLSCRALHNSIFQSLQDKSMCCSDLWKPYATTNLERHTIFRCAINLKKPHNGAVDLTTLVAGRPLPFGFSGVSVGY